MIQTIINFLKMIFLVGAEWLLRLLSIAGLVVFGLAAYAIIQHCRKPHPISKKTTMTTILAGIGSLGLFAYLLKINLKQALLEFPLLTYLPFDKRTDIASHPTWLQYVILGGFIYLAWFLGKRLFKAQTIKYEGGNSNMQGKPIYFILWLSTFGLLQLGYLFNIDLVIQYGIPITIITTLSMIFMHWFIFRSLNNKPDASRKEFINDLSRK